MNAENDIETLRGQGLTCGLPVETAVLFSDREGVYRPQIEKSKTALLRKLGFLTKFLDADEKIVFVTTGCSPLTALERVALGAVWATAIKRALFVFTDKRLLHIPTTPDYEYQGSISQILYQDCTRLQVKGSGLVVEYHNGKQERFRSIPLGDRAIIKRLQPEPDESDQPSARPQRNHLCPNCTELLPPGAVRCPSCRLEFKHKVAALKYLLVPGGGYFYTRHVSMAIAGAAVESYLLFCTLMLLLAGLLGESHTRSGFLMFGVVLVLEKLITVLHSSGFLSEFIPKDLKTLVSEPRTPLDLPIPTTPATPEEQPQGIEDILKSR